MNPNKRMIEEIPDISEFNRIPVKDFVNDENLVKLIISSPRSLEQLLREDNEKDTVEYRLDCGRYKGNIVFRESTQSSQQFIDDLEKAGQINPGNIAVIVSYKDLMKYQEYFPHHRVQCYESVSSFWNFSSFGCDRDPRREYKKIYELSNDKEFWNIDRSTQDLTSRKEISIDVIVNTVIESFEDKVLRSLAAARWKHFN
jgi:hypothetical protein